MTSGIVDPPERSDEAIVDDGVRAIGRLAASIGWLSTEGQREAALTCIALACEALQHRTNQVRNAAIFNLREPKPVPRKRRRDGRRKESR